MEAGFVDATRGGDGWSTAGGLVLENLLANNRGADGIVVQVLGALAPGPRGEEDEYSYAVKVVREPAGTRVVARCPATLFFREYPARPQETLGARIAEDLRAHSAAFTAWRAKGGTVGYAERNGVQDARGTACAASFSNWLERHYRANGTLEDGPANGWWNAAYSRKSIGNQIKVGQGEAALTVTKKTMLDLPEYRSYVRQLRIAGTVVLVYAALSLLFSGGNVFYSLWIIIQNGFGGFWAMRWPFALLVLSTLLAFTQLYVGWALRALESRTWIMVLSLGAMLPCWGPCCFPGVPLGIWVVYLVTREKAYEVFPQDGGVRSVTDLLY